MSGLVRITNNEYKAFSTNALFNPASGALDIVFALMGSSTKTVKINRTKVTGNQTTASDVTIYALKLTGAPTGGTPVSDTVVPLDSTNVAGTATATHYTANPTRVGTVYVVEAAHMFIPAPLTVYQGLYIFDWSVENIQPVILRGITEGMALSLGAGSLSGGQLSVTPYWTEE